MKMLYEEILDIINDSTDKRASTMMIDLSLQRHNKTTPIKKIWNEINFLVKTGLVTQLAPQATFNDSTPLTITDKGELEVQKYNFL